ncbi:MAG: aminoacyl-tRNA hydrolase [Cyanobacteria bacterium P01_D01_bin.128]
MADADTPTALLCCPSLVVGLGNPGAQYERTRHNVGFDVVDLLAQRWQGSLAENKRFKGRYGEIRIRGGKVGLLKPLTFMNRSGQAIRAVMDWYKFSANQVLVVYDDMDLPVGKLRLRLNGSAGGHNGMKSAISHLGTQDFPRLRLGIGATNKDGDRDQAVVSHVLGRFSPEEGTLIKAVIELSADAVERSIRDGVEKAMTIYNGQSAVL